MMQITRRSLLQGAGAAGLGVGLATVAAPATPARALVADEYDDLRQRYVERITVGPGFDHTIAPFSTELTAIESAVQGLQATMTPGSTTGLWPDIPISSGTRSGAVTAGYGRLSQMAVAWATPHCSFHQDPALIADIIAGIDWMHAHAFNSSVTQYGNWWDWRIGSPATLLNILAIAYPHLTATQISENLATIDAHSPDSHLDTLLATKQSTGANRSDLSLIRVLHGVVGKSSAKITTGVNGFSPLFAPVRSNDGFYEDGSFVQHEKVPYLGNYGHVLISGLASAMALVSGSTWQFDDPKVSFIYDMFERGVIPFMFNGLVMDNQSGRRVARGIITTDARPYEQNDHHRGHAMISALLQLSESAPTATAARIRAVCKGWLQREYWGRYMEDHTPGLANLARAKAVIDDSSVLPEPEPIGSRVFGATDRAVHRRADWALAISMCSSRTTFLTSVNQENLRGWHANSGMVSWWGRTYGNGQYSDAFWPTVDPYRMPGTTVSRKPLADGQGGYNQAVPNAWAGGATDGTYAVVGQDTRGLASTLRAKKSWFCLADQVVCLGAGIASTDGHKVETTIDSRNLGATGSAALTVDGAVQPATLPTETSFAAASWAAIQGFGGYVFPGGGSIRARREERTGAWSDINKGGVASTDPITRRYITLWFDHGTDPTAGAYAYILMPGASPATTAARAASPTVTILANTASVQAVKDAATGVTAANFFAAGTAGPITVSAPCSVLIRESGGTLSVSVADPSQKSSTVAVTIDRAGLSTFSTATSAPEMSVTRHDAKIELVAEVGACLGASRTITFGTGTTLSDRTLVNVAATADATVRDGSYATTNYGSDADLVVKNSSDAGYSRRAYLKFDVSGVTATPRRAVLWVYGKTSDSNGKEAVLTANRCSTDQWTETGVNWSTKPPFSGAVATAPIGEYENWLAFDVTNLVVSDHPGDGVVTIGLSGTAGGNLVQLNSRSNAANKPYLEVLTG
ncbi:MULTISPECIES: polysaccharide lyase family 8 super-sandwich domain-containing protein [Microbacterium]|uniref:polysaccharide lyase family 8 super-sandwich domain-containing protein n=1 Tax=Microbacterium TaxID=33882 RepID=UPI001469A58B|nr:MULTISPECIES: polysaccharide lyase family 8 super-sandwich domain-containing protein [Microbacterium]